MRYLLRPTHRTPSGGGFTITHDQRDPSPTTSANTNADGHEHASPYGFAAATQITGIDVPANPPTTASTLRPNVVNEKGHFYYAIR